MGFEIPEHAESTPSAHLASPSAVSAKPSVVVSHHPLGTPYAPTIAETQPAKPQQAATAFDADNPVSFTPALIDAIEDFLQTGFSIVVDGFGILSPEITGAARCYSLDGEQVRRWEDRLTVSFDKCREVTAFHRERFPRLIDTKDLARAVHLALSCEDGLRLSERATRRRLVTFFRSLRQQVIERGFSAALAPLGDFYALHNRQGATTNDRFAGADIFIVPRFGRRLRLGDTRRFERPILENAWEIFEAAYSAPVGRLRIDLAAELRALGYSLSAAEEAQFLGEKLIEVGVFATGERESKPILTYVTDGVRRLARGRSDLGNELTFQLPVSRHDETNGKFSIPEWPTRALTLGWLLVLSSRSRSIEPGVGFTADVPLIPDCDTDLCAVFTTRFQAIRTPQREREGDFSFINIVGITAAEATLAHRFGGSHLLNLLTHRSLDQATKPTRSSVIARSVVEPPPTVVI